jgi:hypothetical protein
MRSNAHALRVRPASGLAGAEPDTAPDELIEKPFTSTELLTRVRAVLGRRALSAAS